MKTNLQDLYLFTQVVAAGSLTGAAKVLGIPKSKLSRRLSLLEQQIGSPLLSRTTRKQSLTESGSLLYQRCLPHVTALAKAEEDVGDLISLPRGKLRVQLPLEFLSRLVSEIITEFAEQYPQIELCCSHYAGMLPDLSDAFDLCFVLHVQDLPDSNWIARSLMSIPQSIYGPGFKSCKDVINPEDLSGRDCILNSGETHWLFRDKHKIQTVPVKGRIFLSSPEMRKGAAISGLGLVKLPDYLCEAEVRTGALQALKLSAPPVAQQLSVLQQSRDVPVKTRAFLDYFQTHIGRLYSIIQ
jgi:DNA-binding transcriptional LysR family regulator